MPVQDWTINIAPAAAGDQYGLATTNSQRLTYNVEAAQDQYGLAVQQGTKANQIKVGSDTGRVLGITMRENKLESKTRPGDGTIGIPVGYPIGVMLEGAINVKLVTAITDANVGVSATGGFGGVGAGYTKALNVVALKYPAAAGDIVPVMINLLGPKS
mgnify:CR=1 FL=1